jgi:hypothetical protein
VWWDPDLAAQLARAGRARRILAYQICDWLVSTRALLLDRGMMGDGVIDLPRIGTMIEQAGYRGYIEVKIFSAGIGVVMQAIGRRIDADHGVADAEHQAIEDARGDSARVIGWMIGRQARGESPRQPDRVAEGSDDRALRRDHDQVLCAQRPRPFPG